MKRITFLCLLFLVLFPLTAGYAPSVTLYTGANALIYEGECYYSLKMGLEAAPLSFRMGYLTLSLPVSVSQMTRSIEKDGLMSNTYYKNGIGLEALLDNRTLGGSLALFYGYERFPEEYALMKYIEVRAGFHFIPASFFCVILPVSWTYTPLGSEVTAAIALRIGGEL